MARLLVGAVVLVAAAGLAGAQPPVPGGGPPPRPPAFSPYLNLTRPGGSVTLNYFGLVRPEVQAREAIRNLNQDVMANREAIGELESDTGGVTELPGTGFVPSFGTRPPYFLNTGGYFSTRPSSGGLVGGAGVGRGTIRPVSTLGGVDINSQTPGFAGAGGRVIRPVNNLNNRPAAPRP
jgi:hypothetical protein